MGTVSVESVVEPRAEAFYWATITLSQTLGTALGDWAADDGGFGYLGGALLFGGILAVLALLYRFARLSHVACSGQPLSSPVRLARQSAISRQAARQGRARLQPSGCLGGADISDGRD